VRGSQRSDIDEPDEKPRGFPPAAPPTTVEYDIGPDERVSSAVIHAVSAVRGRDPRAMQRLADVLDPDALDALFELRADGTSRRGGRLAFVYGKCHVTVDNGEYITVRPLDARHRGDGTPGGERTQ